MGELNTVPMRINGVEGVAGEVKISGGPGVLETWGAAGGGAFTEIGDTTLGGPAASISFAGIAAGYAFFMVIFSNLYGDGVANQTIQMTFNGDGGNNYDSSPAFHATAFIGCNSVGTTGGEQRHLSGVIYINNRASYQKVATLLLTAWFGDDNDVTPFNMGGKWRNVADEIATITFTLSAGNFTTGSRIILLGVST